MFAIFDKVKKMKGAILMKRKWLLLIVVSLFLGGCFGGTSKQKDTASDVPAAAAVTFTEQEKFISGMAFRQLVGINFENYTQGSVFIWAIDQGRVVQEYLSPQYSTADEPMVKMLIGFKDNPANSFTYDVTTAIYGQSSTGLFQSFLSTDEAQAAWCEGEADPDEDLLLHLYQPEKTALDGRYHVLAAFWLSRTESKIDEAAVFTINPEESLSDFFDRVSQNTDMAYVIMAEPGATFPL